MPVILRSEVDIERRVQRRVHGMARPNEPVFKVAVKLLRACSTVAGVDARGQAIGWYLDFCRNRKIDPLLATEEDIEEYLAQIRHLSANTRRGRLSHVRALFKAAGRDVVDPTQYVHVTSVEIVRQPALREVECRRLVDAIRADLKDPGTRLVAARDLLLHLLLIVLGPRRAAVTRLAWDDFFVSAENQEAVQTSEKFGKVHLLPMPPSLVDARDLWRALAEEAIGRSVGAGDAVFPGMSRASGPLSQYLDKPVAPMSPTGLGEIVRRRLVHAQIPGPKLGPHRLRATAATQAYINGADLRDVQALLNHVRLETTMLYIRPVEQLRVAAPYLNPLAEYDIEER